MPLVSLPPMGTGNELRRIESQPVSLLLAYHTPPLPLTHFHPEAIYFQQHPGGGNTAVVATQRGRMSLVALPLVGTGNPVKVLGTWLDLTPRVDSRYEERGLLSFAFHPNFVSNGRFFVSYICDAKKVPDCQVGAAAALPPLKAQAW